MRDMTKGINLDELPEEIQKELLTELSRKFDVGRRASRGLPQEQKVLRVAAILRILEGCTVPQQKSILRYTIVVLENAQHRFWRDGHEPRNKSSKGKEPGTG